MANTQNNPIKENEISSAASRYTLFSTLLEKSSYSKGGNNGRTEFSALCRLLKLWPSFSKSGAIDNPWRSLFQSMIVSGCHDNTLLVLDTIKTTDTGLSLESVEALYTDMVQQGYSLEAVKFSLVLENQKIFPVAIELLSELPQINEDAELIVLLLKHHLVPDLVPTQHYPVIVQYVLANQDPENESCDHLSVKKLANELIDRGFEAEAGSLMLKAKATPPMLQTFGTALRSVKNWFK